MRRPPTDGAYKTCAGHGASRSSHASAKLKFLK